MIEMQDNRSKPSIRKRFLSWPTLLSFALVTTLLLLLLNRFELDWRDTWNRIQSSNPRWFIAALLAHYSTFIFRGARWRVLLGNTVQQDGAREQVPPALYCGKLILMSWFANSITWFRLGDAYRAYAYAEDSGSSFSRAMGTVLAERVIDVMVVFLLLLVAAIVLYSGGQVRPSLGIISLAGAFFLLMTVILAMMLLLRKWVSGRVPKKFWDAYHRFHIATIGSFRRLPLVLVLGIAGWLAEVGRLFFVLLALGIQIPMGLTIFTPVANGLLTAVPLTPGGLGITETGLIGVLMFSLVREDAVAVALLDRTISYLSIILTGGIIFVLRQIQVARRSVTKAT